MRRHVVRRAVRGRTLLATAGALLLTACAQPAQTPTVAAGTAPAAPSHTSGPARPTGTATPSSAPSPTPSRTATPSLGMAARAAGDLRVRGRGALTGYDRDRFGYAWLDADRNGCDTRNDVLRRDLTRIILDPRTHGCVVLSGELRDPYSGAPIAFVRGGGVLVDIDHVVALANAWVSGANRWDVRERAALANDPLNLLAVDAGLNRSKGDGDAATWLPPAKGFRCAYVARQVAVKRKFDLSVTPAEHAALLRVLSRCPGQRLPPDSGAPLLVPFPVSDG